MICPQGLCLLVIVASASGWMYGALSLSRSSTRQMASLSSAASAASAMCRLRPDVRNQVIILAGATSVGKSKAARQLCQSGRCEIIIADSVQIYRHLDIGSNKPSAEELAETPHHLVNICDAHDDYSCGDFVKAAVPIIYDVLNRGKVPVVVGGSTMWLQWLVHGVPDAPKASPVDQVEARRLLLEASEDWDRAVEIVSQYDPARTRRLGRNDWYRLQRYLEVALSVRRLRSEEEERGEGHVAETTDDAAVVGGDRTKVLADLDLRCFFLSEKREQLYHTIDSRCEMMLKQGLVQEVAGLLMEERLTPSAVASKAIGYRQTIEYLCRPRYEELSIRAFDAYVKDFATATRNYAKRQMQWYRKDAAFLWLSIDRPDPAASASSSDLAPYAQVAREIDYWCSLPESNFGQIIKQQMLRALSVQSVRKKKHHGHRIGVDKKGEYGEREWLAVAALVSSGEIGRSSVPELLKPSTPASSSPLTPADAETLVTRARPAKAVHGHEPFNGLELSAFPESPLPPTKWSAEDVLIRAADDALGAASAMKRYQSRFESIGVGAAKEVRGDFDAVLRAADESCKLLRLRHPALLEDFRGTVKNVEDPTNVV